MNQTLFNNKPNATTDTLQYAILSTKNNALQAQTLCSILENKGYTVDLTYLDDDTSCISTQILNQSPCTSAEKVLTLVDETASGLQLIDLRRNTSSRLTQQDFLEGLIPDNTLQLSIH